MPVVSLGLNVEVPFARRSETITRVHFSTKLLQLSVVVLALLLGPNAHGAILTDLGGGYAYGINSSGQAVGQNAAGHAFFYSNGISTDLGTLGGDYSFALGLNDSGQVVGWAQSAGGATHGFLFSNGSMTNLSPGSLTGGAQGINSSGQVVGWYSSSSSSTQPYLYSNGVQSNVGTFPSGSNTYPLSINDSGQVVGYTYQTGVTGEQPFIIENGTTTILGVSGAFQKINAGGQAVGGQYLSGTVWHAQLYSNGTLTDLGTLGGLTSWAYGINDAGQMVGTSSTASGANHAFLYSNGTMTDLNSLIDPSSGWVLKTASAINDNGQIVGWGEKDGETRAFLLNTVPEPASLVIWGGIGVAGLIAGWRRSRNRDSERVTRKNAPRDVSRSAEQMNIPLSTTLISERVLVWRWKQSRFGPFVLTRANIPPCN